MMRFASRPIDAGASRGFAPDLRRLALGLAAGALLAGSASAQIASSRLSKPAEAENAEQMFLIWAGCVAEIEGKWSASLLDTVPTTAAEETVWSKHEGYNDRCLEDPRLVMDNRQLTFSGEMGRGAIARHLAARKIREGSAPHPGAATAWLYEKLEALPKGTSYQRSVLVAHEFAACMADNHFPQVAAFVAAAPGKPDDTAALGTLAPLYSNCMTRGAKLSLNVPLLRTLLSESAYHALTHVPKAPQ